MKWKSYIQVIWKGNPLQAGWCNSVHLRLLLHPPHFHFHFLFVNFHFQFLNIYFQEILCKLAGIIQSTCIFFSSFSILLIAIDRYFFIVHPTGNQISIKQVLLNNFLWIFFIYSNIIFVFFSRHFSSQLLLSWRRLRFPPRSFSSQNWRWKLFWQKTQREHHGTGGGSSQSKCWQIICQRSWSHSSSQIYLGRKQYLKKLGVLIWPCHKERKSGKSWQFYDFWANSIFRWGLTTWMGRLCRIVSR